MQTPRWSRKADLEASDAGGKVRRGCAYSEFGYELSAPDWMSSVHPFKASLTMRHVVIQGCIWTSQAWRSCHAIIMRGVGSLARQQLCTHNVGQLTRCNWIFSAFPISPAWSELKMSGSSTVFTLIQEVEMYIFVFLSIPIHRQVC